MNAWSQIPFLRLLLPFIAGILSAVYSGMEFEFLHFVLPALFIVIAIFIFIKRLNASYSYSWIFGIIITMALFISGFQITVLNTGKFKTDHFSRFKSDAGLYFVKVNEPYLEKERSYKISVSVLAVKENDKWISTSGYAMCYFKKDSLSKQLKYGDCLILKTDFAEIKPPQNPGEFNYKRFLSHHNIYHQAYIPSEKWRPAGMNSGNRILKVSYDLKEYLLNIYRENKITGDEYAVGSALVLGYTDKLDPDIISAYASSGTLHVLSVSGLHVGIIFILCNYLLFFLDKVKYGKSIKCISLLFIIWFYATLTGLSPSVLRSAAMFTFIIIAQTWKYNTTIFNTLAVSCFFLLLYNPFMLMDVGFQLSYLAVLGIVSIQPWIYEKWQPRYWLLNQVWLITSVSIAAQVTTFPLSLFYFSQFPNYFLFSNLIVIPVSTIVLIYGILLFILGKFSAIGIFCGKIFTGIVWFLNESVQFFEHLPGALFQGISLSVFETLIIYTLTVFIILFLYKKSYRYFLFSLTSLIILFTFQAARSNSSKDQKSFIVYNIPKTSAYDFISSNSTVLLADSSLIRQPGKIVFHIRHNWWNRYVSDITQIEKEKRTFYQSEMLYIRNKFIQFGSRKIAVIDSLPNIKTPVKDKLFVDLILLSDNPNIKIADLKKWFTFNKIIIDSSNKEWRNEKWKKECENLKIDFYSVIDSGAYIENEH